MKIKLLFAALALSLAPSFALAYECGGFSHTASACAAGQSYDAATGTCVNATS